MPSYISQYCTLSCLTVSCALLYYTISTIFYFLDHPIPILSDDLLFQKLGLLLDPRSLFPFTDKKRIWGATKNIWGARFSLIIISNLNDIEQSGNEIMKVRER